MILNISKLDDTIPHDWDLAPGMPGNTTAPELREVRRKINEIIIYLEKRDNHAQSALV